MDQSRAAPIFPYMKRRTVIITVSLAVACGIVLAILATQVNLSALPEPRRTETAIATRGKHFLVARASRSGIPPAPPWSQSSVAEGQRLYETECSLCHGVDGHTLTDNGRWMYPRAANLTSPEVQQYSDAELFWVVKNGIRLSGMPAFGQVETDENLWHLVHYVRSLRKGQNNR